MTSPLVPTATPHVLPFDRLSPLDFERLCLALVRGEGYERVEHPGAAGGEQGRDLIARRGATRIAFQCKRVQRFGPADARAEVSKLLALPPDERPHEVVFLVSCVVSEGARAAARKAAAGEFTCEFWAVTELDTRLRRHPEIVRDFFRPVPADAPPSPAEILETARAASAAHLDAALRKIGRKYRPELYVARPIDPSIQLFLRQRGRAAAKVLIATAGTGKTNLVCHMAGHLRELRIPCVLLLGSDPLRDRRSLLEDVLQALGIAPGADWRQALRALSTQGVPVAVLLDGINEARDVELMQHALRELLAETAPHLVRVLVTCRDIYWTFLEGDWTEAMPTEILRPDLYHYEEEAWPVARAKYFSAYRVRGTLLGEADRRCRHPLLFRFFCEAYEGEDVSTVEQIRLPPLFEKYLERKVAQIARERTSQLRAEERVTAILHSIAAEMLDTRAKSVPEERIPTLTQDRDHLDRGAFYVRLLDEDIMIEEVPDERLSALRRRVRFVYEAFFEFMLARVLAGRWEPLSNPEIVTDLLERLEPSAGLPNVLGSLQFLGDFFSRRGLNVWKVLLGKGGAWQSLVVQSLGEMRPEEIDGPAREAFRELATAAPPNLRAAAFDLLRKPDLRVAYDPSFDLLTLAVRSDRRAEVRAAAQTVLLDNPRELDDEQMTLLARTLFDRAKIVRLQARLIVDHVDDRLADSMASEIRRAFTSPDPRVRSAAAQALDPGWYPRERPLLLQGLQDESSWVRSACLLSLSGTREPTSGEIAAVAESLSDPERRVRIAAARVCRAWGAAELILPLLRRIGEEEDPGVLAALLATAGKVGGADAVPVLREHLGHPHLWVFRRAGWGLFQILGAPALDELVSALRQRSDIQRWPWGNIFTLTLPGQLGASLEEVLPQLTRLGFKTPDFTPVTGAFLFGSHATDFVLPGDDELLQAIEDLVARDTDPVSSAFFEGLCLDDESSSLVDIADLTDVLLRRARRPDPRITAPAVQLLVASQTPIPDDLLESLLKSPHTAVRRALARGLLAASKSPKWLTKAFLALIPAALEDPTVRDPVIEALSGIVERESQEAAGAKRLRSLFARTSALLLDLEASLAPDDRRRARLLQLLALYSSGARSVDERARILARFRSLSSPVLRAVAFSKGEIPTGDWPPEIIAEALADPSTVVVKTALQLLNERGAEAIRVQLPAVLFQLGSRNRAVRIEGAKALAELSREEAEAPLLKLLADPERTVRRQAVELLPGLLGNDAIPHLLLALRDPAPLVRIEVCLQLARTPAPEVLEALLARLQDTHDRVREQAFKSLAALDPNLARRHAALLDVPDESPREDDDIPF